MIKNVSYLESSVDNVIDTLVRGVYATFHSDRKCKRTTISFEKVIFMYEWDINIWIQNIIYETYLSLL